MRIQVMYIYLRFTDFVSEEEFSNYFSYFFTYFLCNNLMNHSDIWAYSIISLIDLSCESKRFFWRFWLIFCTWIRFGKTGFELENYFIPRPGYNINVWSVELNEAKKGDRGATGDWKTDEGTRIWKHSIIILAFIY